MPPLMNMCVICTVCVSAGSSDNVLKVRAGLSGILSISGCRVCLYQTL